MDRLQQIWYKHRAIRYIGAGILGFLINIFILFLLTDIFELWYGISATISFIIATIASFFLQKYITFTAQHERFKYKEVLREMVSFQFGGFGFVSIINLFVNDFIIVFAVEALDMHYVLGQVCASLIVAVWSYAVYSKVIFKKKSHNS